MRFEHSAEIAASQQRVWEVISDLEAWPRFIETVDEVEILGPDPMREGSRVRIKQPRLPEGTWQVTSWEAPSYFEYFQKANGVTTVAGHRIEPGESEQTRLRLHLEMRGLLVPLTGVLFRGLITRYIGTEAASVKRVAEA